MISSEKPKPRAMIRIFNRACGRRCVAVGKQPECRQQDRNARAAEHQYEGAHQLGGEDAAVVLWFHARTIFAAASRMIDRRVPLP